MLERALYIVPTPLGNLEDITARAVRVLKEATLVAAEDTRHSSVLLTHLGLGGKKMMSCHDHNEEQKAGIIIAEIEAGGSVALISDAGSPLINDPGYKLVSSCIKSGVKVVPLPGPCALITALEAAAQPTDRFSFMGFFPVKEKELTDCLNEVATLGHTCVFYEAPHRIVKTCEVLAKILPAHEVTLCREMTKTFESFYRMKACELPEFLKAASSRVKGEFVVVIGPAPKTEMSDLPSELLDALQTLLNAGTPSKVAASALSTVSGVKRNLIYEKALSLKQSKE